MTLRQPDQPDWRHYQHQAVRDLAWAVFSTPLMAQLPGSDAQLIAPKADATDLRWLERLDRQPEPLLAALSAGHSTRLGLYFERLWQFYLQQHPRWSLLAHNLPVTRAGRTLGAFDFLCRHDAQYWHLELTVKFYLGTADTSRPDGTSRPEDWLQWLGPDTNDRLDIKLNRLRDHQLALSQNPHSSATLKEVASGDVPWRRGLVIKGYYFYPGRSGEPRPHPAPEGAHPLHERGTWRYLDEFLPQLSTAYWYRPSKMSWLSPVQLREPHRPLSAVAMEQALQEVVGEAQRPVLLARMAPHGSVWHEQERVFVVPDHWPGVARP